MTQNHALFMFTGTVAQNVAYGDNGRSKPTLEEIKKQSKLVKVVNLFLKWRASMMLI